MASPTIGTHAPVRHAGSQPVPRIHGPTISLGRWGVGSLGFARVYGDLRPHLLNFVESTVARALPGGPADVDAHPTETQADRQSDPQTLRPTISPGRVRWLASHDRVGGSLGHLHGIARILRDSILDIL